MVRRRYYVCSCDSVANANPCSCASPDGVRTSLASQNSAGSRGDRICRFLWDCLHITVNTMKAEGNRVAEVRLTIELMTVQMLRPRVALSAAFMRTIEFLVEPFPAALPFPRLSVLRGFRPLRLLPATSLSRLSYSCRSSVLPSTP